MKSTCYRESQLDVGFQLDVTHTLQVRILIFAKLRYPFGTTRADTTHRKTAQRVGTSDVELLTVGQILRVAVCVADTSLYAAGELDVAINRVRIAELSRGLQKLRELQEEQLTFALYAMRTHLSHQYVGDATCFGECHLRIFPVRTRRCRCGVVEGPGHFHLRNELVLKSVLQTLVSSYHFLKGIGLVERRNVRKFQRREGH